MCGIAGIYHLERPADERAAVTRMMDALAHRGPDAEGCVHAGRATLGHRRLSIIDLSQAANQPFEDASGRYVLVFNGEVYNFREVRAQLKGYPFRTQSDTEVVVAAYARWGAACLERFNGMFALAVYDREEESLFLARDRLGIKPLYFASFEGGLVFASELRALLAAGKLNPRLDKRAVVDYLSYQTVHAPATIVAGVEQLEAGSYLLVKDGQMQRAAWWSPIVGDTLNGHHSYETVRQQVRERLLRSVERRLVSDVPIGAFLSGGIDSSAVVALMAQVSDQKVDTFSIVFEEAAFDESPYSRLIAERYGTRHHPILLKPNAFLEDLPAALKAMDAPSGDGVNTYTVSKVTKAQGITVALSGLGGDELFAGYPYFLQFLKFNHWRWLWKLPVGLRKSLGALLQTLRPGHRQEKLRAILGAPTPAIEHVYPALRKVLSPRDLGRLSPRLPVHSDAVHSSLQNEEGLQGMPLLSQFSVADLRHYTLNVLLRDTDQMSMAHALEVRVPFFDHELVEYVLRIPDRWKYPTFAKKLLVEALDPLLPPEIVFRRKMGFFLPWAVWMKNELRPFCEQRLQAFAERLGSAPAYLDAMWQTFLQGRDDRLWSRLWVMVVLEDWLQRNLDPYTNA
ncbi:MAG: asparagine synthase (glutamine-hydrolyzing) [Bacteroidetes bacterium]|nr:MAG: asparagine synthase (glutamine-hydrolyzing) [Bacteroidota bacterium]